MNQELMFELEGLNKQSQENEERLKIVEQQIAELQGFEKNLGELETNKNKEVLASLGKGVFIKADLREEDLFVEVGSGILVKKSLGDSKKIAEQQNRKLLEMKTQLLSENESISEKMRKALEKINH
jgi:prefoldin alpha subunit|tara:strand:+ start:237 stop:614 length:378 start_codon:yes stop_codon:yes gene_type:complete